jgi:hypothetical protein
MDFRYLFLVIALVVIATPCLALPTFTNVKYDIGETWIEVTWNSSVTANIYSDGTLLTDDLSGNTTATNNSVGYYYMSKLGANSRHSIQLVNASNPLDYKIITATTLPPASIVQILFVVVLCLVVLSLFMRVFEIRLTLLIFAIVISTYARTLSYHYYSLDWIFLLIDVLAGVFIALLVYDHFSETISWG